MTETQATASSRPAGGNSVNSNGIEKDIFARKPTRSSLTDQKMVDAKAQILVNQFSNTITKEQASFVLSENNMDVKKAIKSIKVRLGWIPRNFKIFNFKPKFWFLNENHKNDNWDEFTL